jgi:hypothetical protein
LLTPGSVVLNAPGEADHQALAPAAAQAPGGNLTAPYRPRSPLQLSAWLSGDFSLGFLPNHKKTRDPHPLADLGADWGLIAWFARLQMPAVGWMPLEQLLTLMTALEEAGSNSLAIKTAHAINRGLVQTDLGLSVLSNSPNSGPQRKIRRGLKGITTRQRRQVKSAGVLLEKRYGRENLSFLTLTLPALSQEHILLINSRWSELIKGFIKELGRELKRHGLEGEIVSVTEIQEQRLKGWGQVCLHAHMVFRGRLSAWQSWAIDKQWVKDLWNRQLELVIGAPFDGRATTRIERPRKSLKKELGKYLSKGSKVITSVVELGLGEQLPRGWVNISLCLRRDVFNSIKKISGDAITNFWDRRNELQSIGLIRFREILIPADHSRGRPRDLVIGIAGYLTCEVSELPLFDNLAELDAWILAQIPNSLAA